MIHIGLSLQVLIKYVGVGQVQFVVNASCIHADLEAQETVLMLERKINARGLTMSSRLPQMAMAILPTYYLYICCKYYLQTVSTANKSSAQMLALLNAQGWYGASLKNLPPET